MTELDATCDRWVSEILLPEPPAPADAATATDEDDGFLEVPERVLLGVARLQVELFVVVDPRARRGVRHPLITVLTIAILGCICGCDNAEALEDWGHKEARWLRELVPLPHGAPGQDVFLRVFAAIDPIVFRGAFRSWANGFFASLSRPGQIAIDGQTSRGSHDRASGRRPVHVVNAYDCSNGLVTAQEPVDAKSNEIRAVPLLLQLFHIRGALVSIDSMGCQVQIAKAILAKGGDYLLGLKGNQSALHEQTRGLFDEVRSTRQRPADAAHPPACDHTRATDADHGRIEVRDAWTCTGFERWVPAAGRWPGLKTLVCVASSRTDKISGATTSDTRYFISSRRMTASDALSAVRRHWAIENGLHHVLDVTFGQDADRTRTANAAENLNVVRAFAINGLRAFTGDKLSLPRRRRLCDYNPDYRDEILASFPAG